MKTDEIKSTLLKALEGPGKLIQEAISRQKTITKKTELSLVTEIDKAAEDLILKTIKAQFPNHSFLAEESDPHGDSPSRWIIDPLDGTTNFAHSYPVACTSIAFEESGVLQAAGVYDPFRDELFIAERGKGATLNGKPIRVSNTQNLGDSLLCTGFPYDRREKMDEYLPIFKALSMKVQGIRRSGSAALDLCYVACGRFDGFWEVKLQPWDKAAGMLLIQEAGGKTTDFFGEPMTLDGTQNVTSNGHIHSEILYDLEPFQGVGK